MDAVSPDFFEPAHPSVLTLFPATYHQLEVWLGHARPFAHLVPQFKQLARPCELISSIAPSAEQIRWTPRLQRIFWTLRKRVCEAWYKHQETFGEVAKTMAAADYAILQGPQSMKVLRKSFKEKTSKPVAGAIEVS